MNEPTGALAVLRHRDFRLLWTGQTLSLVGSRMQGAALGWHLYDLTGSELALGSLGLARLVPLFFFALLGGVLADVLDRRRVMLISQSLMALLAAGLGAWSLLGMRQAWPLYAVAGLSAGIMAFDNPARQSLIPRLVPREELGRAVSLNSLTTQLASIIGPALMGLVIAHHNIGLIYWANAVSFLSVIAALLMMRPVPPEQGEQRPRVSLGAALEGLRFVRQSRVLWSLMLLDFLANFFGAATTLLPVFARDVLHVGSQGYGWLVAAPSLGALAAAAVMAVLPPLRRQGVVVLWAVLCYGIATAAFGLASTFPLALLALAGTGAADTVSMVLRQTMRQMITPDQLRGRMTSINMLFVQGGPHLGEWEAGVVAELRGAPFSVVTGGLGCVLMVGLMTVLAPWLRDYDREPPEEGPAEERKEPP